MFKMFLICWQIIQFKESVAKEEGNFVRHSFCMANFRVHSQSPAFQDLLTQLSLSFPTGMPGCSITAIRNHKTETSPAYCLQQNQKNGVHTAHLVPIQAFIMDRV